MSEALPSDLAGGKEAMKPVDDRSADPNLYEGRDLAKMIDYYDHGADCDVITAGDIARNDAPILAEALRALRDRLAAPPPEPRESGWLIENGNQNEQRRYRSMDESGIHWTPEPADAIRFSRRADAEMFAAGDEDAWGIVEHVFVSAEPAPPSAPPCIFRSGCVNGQPCKNAGHCTEGAEWKRRLGVETPAPHVYTCTECFTDAGTLHRPGCRFIEIDKRRAPSEVENRG